MSEIENEGKEGNCISYQSSSMSHTTKMRQRKSSSCKNSISDTIVEVKGNATCGRAASRTASPREGVQ